MKKTFNLKTIKTLFLSIIAVTLITCFTACSKKVDITFPAQINVINAAETSAPQDFYLDNIKQNTAPIAYKDTTGYISTATGTHTGQFKTSATGTSNVSFPVTFQSSHYYSVYYTDDKGAAGAENDRTAPQPGQAKVRFINLSMALNSAVDFDSNVGSAYASSLAYETFSSYYNVLPTTTFTLNAANSTNVLLNIPATIQTGHIYTIYVTGALQASLSYHIVTEL